MLRVQVKTSDPEAVFKLALFSLSPPAWISGEIEGNCVCGWLGASRRVRYDMPMRQGDRGSGLSCSLRHRQAHPGRLTGRLGPGGAYQPKVAPRWRETWEQGEKKNKWKTKEIQLTVGESVAIFSLMRC